MELSLSGNLLMIRPWMPELEGELFFWRREFSPSGGKPKMRKETMYYTHEVDGEQVGYIPEGLLDRVRNYLNKRNIVYTFKDYRVWSTLPVPDFSKVDVLELRDGQDVALVRIAENYNGVIEAPTSFGKSYLIQQICKMYPYLKIVICTPRKSVVKSLYERLISDIVLKENVGIISSWKNTGSDWRIVVSTVKSLLKTDYEKTDLLMFDECHGVGAVTTSGALAKFSRARKFGFSASPEGRCDGADMALESMFGPVRFDYTYMEAVDAGSVVPIEVHMYTMRGDTLDTSGRIAIKRWGLWKNVNRNKKIAEIVNKYGPDEQVLIMVETLEHAMNLKKELPDYTVVYSNCSEKRYAGFVKRGLTSDKRMSDREMMECQNKFETAELTKVISTSVFREGVNFVHLRALVRGDGLSGAIPNIQIPGRLSRLDKNKEKGILIDFKDTFNETLERSSESRIKHYQKAGWKVIYDDKL